MASARPPRQTPPAQAAVLAVQRTSDALRRTFERILRPHGLTGQQYNVLRILRGAADAAEGPLPTMTIAARMIEQEPGISRLVARLEDKGFIRRVPGFDDARQKLCELTTAGLDLVHSLDAAVSAANERLLNSLDRNEIDQLLALLEAVRSAAADDEPATPS